MKEEHIEGWGRLLGPAFMALTMLVFPFTCGCMTVHRLPAVPENLVLEAQIPGMPGIRFLSDSPRKLALRLIADTFRRQKAYLRSQGHEGPLPPAKYLSLSGGGELGAFGAGLMTG